MGRCTAMFCVNNAEHVHGPSCSPNCEFRRQIRCFHV